MNRQKWKELLTRRSTIWTVSLCLVGAIVLGGIAFVNNSPNNDTTDQSGAQTDQLAYLEEDLTADDSTTANISASKDTDLEEVSGNILENNTSDDDSGSADNGSDSDSAGGTSGNDPDTVSADDTSENDPDAVSADSTSENASENAAANNVSENASDTASADASPDSALSGSEDYTQEVSSSDSISDSDSGTDQETAQEASSASLISEAALIEAGICFTEDQSILWPSAGTVILDYSMDKSVYFATLNQYKYNPALIISSDTGNQVLASASGIVESISLDEETGTTLVLNIGNGYKLIYGQLMEPAVSEGDIVEAGDLLAYISEPTKYYCTEGSNLYFAMTKDGESVDPVLYLE